jgi:hypothetical protein
MTQTNNGRLQRKSLANEIDRLDGILDGLDEALAGAVEMAVGDVTGKVVREAVEATLREVLSNPELIRAALGQHAPVATPVPQHQQRSTLKEWFKQKLNDLRKTAKRNALGAWSWCVAKLKMGCSWLWARSKNVACGVKLAWTFRKTTAVAVIVGVLVGVGAYFAGPVIASSVCGLGGALTTVAGMILWPLWKMMSGGNAA